MTQNVYSRKVVDVTRFDPKEQVPAGSKQQFALAAPIFEHGSTRDTGSGQVVYVPALLVRGRRDGPTLLVSGGVHGDEYEGPEAIRRLFRRLDPSSFAGMFIGLPQVNVMAYEAGSRHTPRHIDGINMARCFPGDPKGQPTERLAHHLWPIVTSANLLVDFHSGGTFFNFTPVAGYYDVDSDQSKLAERVAAGFGLPVLWLIASVPGTLSWEAAQARIPTVSCEYAGEARLSNEGVEAYVKGIENTMAMLGMTPQAPASATAQEPTKLRSHWQTSSRAGLFYPTVSLLQQVNTGQVVGHIYDEYGELLETVVAEKDAVTLGVRTKPRTEAYDWLFCFGVPIEAK